MSKSFTDATSKTFVTTVLTDTMIEELVMKTMRKTEYEILTLLNLEQKAVVTVACTNAYEGEEPTVEHRVLTIAKLKGWNVKEERFVVTGDYIV